MGDSSGTVLRDVILLALFGFVVIVVLLILHIRPPLDKIPGDTPPGNLVVEVSWPSGWETDVDLWVQAPGDVPVGYSNKGGKYFDLLRDDLGLRHNSGHANFEFSYSREIPAGEYTVNLHLYSNAEQKYPIPCTVEIRRTEKVNGSTKVVLIAQVEMNLLNYGEEVTVLRFRMNGQGKPIPSSFHKVFKPIRPKIGFPAR